MKRFIQSLALIATLAFSLSVFADATYPYINPTYIPNANGGSTVFSAPGTYTLTVIGVGTVTTRVSGTCTSLAATLQASNDGVNYTAINLYPIATGTSAPTAVASVSAPGFWKSNASGFTTLNFVISALTASCTVTLVGHPGGFNGTTF